MVSSKLFIALSGGAIATIVGLAEAADPASGAEGSLKASAMLERLAGANYISPCEILGETDTASPFFTLYDMPNSTACRYACMAEGRCQWYTYNTNTKKCYLKEERSGLVASNGDITGPKRCETCELEEWITSFAPNYREIANVKSKMECQERCNKDPPCGWWTYNRFSDYCYLKQSQDRLKLETPGDFTGPPLCENCVLVGQTSRSPDYQVFHDIDTVYTCRARCRSDPRCFWYTYNTGSKKCFLKESRGTINDSLPDDVTAPAECPSCMHEGKSTKVLPYVIWGTIPDPESCKLLCKSQDKCQWWTFSKTEKKCALKESAGPLVPSNFGDVTGPKECENCEIRGKTSNGALLKFYQERKLPYLCQKECQDHRDCVWYNYNTVTKNCALLKEAGELSPSKNPGDLTGPKSCDK